MPRFTRRHSPFAAGFIATRRNTHACRWLPLVEAGAVARHTMHSKEISDIANVSRHRIAATQFFCVCPVSVACWACLAVGERVAVFAATCAVMPVWLRVHCRHAFNGAPLHSGWLHQRSGLANDHDPQTGQTRHSILVMTSRVTQAAQGTPCRSVFRSQVGQ